MFMEGYFRFLDLAILNAVQAPTIANNFVAIVSSSATQSLIASAVCTDTVSNEVSMLNELHPFRCYVK
jgi:hypothetical protein